MYRILYISLLLLVFSQAVQAQNNYSQTNFRTGTTTYTDISGTGTAIAMTDNTAGSSASPQEIGFSFNFNGSTFTQFMIHADGILKLGTAAPGAATDITVSPANSHAAVFTSTAAGFQNIIMPFFTNLVQGNAVPEFHVQTTGAAPNRVCTIQWKNLRDADNSNGGIQHQFSNMEFQVKLYETTNDIEFVYGNYTPSANTVAARNAASGIKATNLSFFGLYRITSSTPYPKAVVFNPTNHGRLPGSYPFRKDVLPGGGFSNRFFGRIANDINVAKVYYDSIAPLGNQTAGRLEALVVNEGTNVVNNIDVTLNISGTNTHNAVVNIASLAAGASQRVTFDAYNLANKGQQDVQVSVAAGSDERITNNQRIVKQVISQGHNQTLDFSTNSNLGVGFTNSTGTLSAIKMYGSGTRKIRQIRIPFGSYRSIVNIRIYEDGGTGGSPSSSPLFSSSNFFTTNENVLIVPLGEGVPVDGDYFIAVQQVGTSNMGWRIFLDPPIRNNRYFNSSSNGVSWGVDATEPPWNFMAEAYEESSATDIGLETLTAPGCDYSSNAEIKARIRNFSANPIDFSTSPTTITGFVRGPDRVEIPISILKNSGTLAAGAAEEITLLNNYNYAARGNHLINARTNLVADVENGNDSLRFVINNNIPITGSFLNPVCPLTSVALTGPSYLSSLQWNADGFSSSGTTRTITPIKTTVVRITGTDYRGCLLQDSVIIEVKGNDLPPRPILLYGDTVLSHRGGFRDTVRVKKLDGHTIQFVEFFANGTVVGDSAYALSTIAGMNGAKVAAAYVRTADGCANLSDTITYSYIPGVLQNNNEPLTVCDTAYYDFGGPVSSTGNNFTRTFTPSTPGTKMKLTIYRLDLAQFASIQIFDGPTASNRIVDLRSPQNGNTTREFISSHETGALTVQFSIGSSTAQGWWAGLTCYTPEVYRTVESGNWITASTWERKAPGGSYLPALRAPVKGDDTVYIRHNIGLSNSTPMDQIIIEDGATFNIENPSAGFISMPAYKTTPQPEFMVKGTLNISPRVQIFGGNGQMIVPGRLNNFGQIDFDSVVFNGTSAQMLGDFSGASGSMNRMHINNPAGLTMGSDQEVSGFRFVNGLITTNSENIITLKASVDPENRGHNGSHINGPLIVELSSGSGERLFPIGKNGIYRPVLLDNGNANSESSDRFTAEVIEGAPPARTLPAGITNVSELRFFRITRNGNSGSEFTVTLPYLTDDGVNDPDNLTILKDNGAGAWLNIGGTISGPVPGTIQSDVFDGFSDFVLANKTGGSNPLPVTWVSFEAEKVNADAHLNWRTAQEQNCSSYEVERSTDGVNFRKLSQQLCRNLIVTQQYQYVDVNPGNGTFFYRIKQIDTDGKFEYSAVRKVSFGADAKILVYPNPARQYITISKLTGVNELMLYDITGRIVVKQKTANPQFTMQTGHLAPGIYELMVVNANGERTTQKVQIIK